MQTSAVLQCDVSTNAVAGGTREIVRGETDANAAGAAGGNARPNRAARAESKAQRPVSRRVRPKSEEVRLRGVLMWLRCGIGVETGRVFYQ
jgi:class 3 adenylate cyclase